MNTRRLSVTTKHGLTCLAIVAAVLSALAYFTEGTDWFDVLNCTVAGTVGWFVRSWSPED